MTLFTSTRMSTLAVATAAAVLGQPALGDTFTYTGPSSSAVWNDSSNWDLDEVPDAGDTAIFSSTTSFTSFGGQSVGVIETIDGATIQFDAAETFTMNNNGATAQVNSDKNISLAGDVLFTFTDDLSLVGDEITTSTLIQGPGTLSVTATEFNAWKASEGTAVDVGRLDVSGSSKVTADRAMPDFTGQTVYLGTTPIVHDWDPELAPGLYQSHIEMDESYQFLHPSAENTEHVELASWLVGTTDIPAGTYDANSSAIGDADFATIFSDTGATVTVIPEPASLALLGLGGLLIVSRRRLA